MRTCGPAVARLYRSEAHVRVDSRANLLVLGLDARWHWTAAVVWMREWK
jgi:hypothetical protein